MCVGRPVPRVEIAIAEMDELGRTTGTILDTPGVSREILVRAPHVRDRYLMLWRTTRTAMRFEGWHATGDVGHLDEAGRLWVEGRADHVLATPRHAHPGPGRGGRRVGAHGAPCGRRGRRPPRHPADVVILETEQGYRPGRAGRPRPAEPSLQEAVRRAVRDRSGAEVVAVFTTRALPTDIRHNSKIDRAALSRWSEQTLRGQKADSL